MKRKIVLMGAIAGMLLLAGCAGTPATPAPATPCSVNCTYPTQALQRTISVVGEGTVKVTPDIALIYMSVISRSPDVSQAWDDNNAKATAVIAAIEGLGVKAEDIQSDFNLSQQEKFDPTTGQPTGDITYIVTHTFTVTGRDLTKIGAILGAAQAAGVNSVSGVSFTLEDPKPASLKARDLAMADALAKAQQMAKDLGVTVGRVMAVNEYGVTVPQPLDKGYAGMTGIGGGAGGSSVPIQVGTWQVSVSISVVFEIQ